MQIVSHLYKSDGSILGAFQRIDIPILREFDQYNYVLFTGGHGISALRRRYAVLLGDCSRSCNLLQQPLVFLLAMVLPRRRLITPLLCRLRRVLQAADEAHRLGCAAAASAWHGVSEQPGMQSP